MKLIAALVAALAVAGLTTAAMADRHAPRTHVQAARAPALHADCSDARQAVSYYRRLTWSHQRAAYHRLANFTPKAQGHSCPFVRYAASEWRARAHVSARTYYRWRYAHYLRDPGDWERAVHVVQRVYPGTDSWLMSCSSSEGGHGQWVPNKQGSGAGGWLQFLRGTFDGFSRHAYDEARNMGYVVPETSARSWYSPLGQALAGAWAYHHGLTYHWYGGGC